jgi:hypothetical protein
MEQDIRTSAIQTRADITELKTRQRNKRGTMPEKLKRASITEERSTVPVNRTNDMIRQRKQEKET